MKENPISLECLKCDGTIIIQANQTLGKCNDCDTLHPLPQGLLLNQQELLSNKTQAIIERYNRANELAKSYQFHKAYNAYDKMTKTHPDDFYGYWGKVLAQFGVAYRLNQALENEVICLRTNLERIFDNENYKKACELADMHALTIIKKEALQIERFMQTSINALIKAEHHDVFILVNDTHHENDLKIAQSLETQLVQKGLKVNLPLDVFKPENFSRLETIIYPALELAPIMIVVSSDIETANEALFRNIWIRYLRLIKDSDYHLKTYYLSNELPNQPLHQEIDFYQYVQVDLLVNDVLNQLTKLDLTISDTAPSLLFLNDLLKQGKFEDVRKETLLLTKADETNHFAWWLALLSKNGWESNKAMAKWAGDLSVDFYYRKAYVHASLPYKKHYYQMYKQALKNQEDLEIAKTQKKESLYLQKVETEQQVLYKDKLKEVRNTSLILFGFILLSYLTLSVGSLLSITSVILGFGLVYFLFVKTLIQIFVLGKIPKEINTNLDDYFHDIKEKYTPLEASSLLPSSLFKRLRQLTVIIGSVSLIFSMTFILKESIIAINYHELNYYYVFNQVVINGGKGEYINIPSQIGRKNVTTIRKRAFYQQEIKQVTIASGVKVIESEAFANCPLLEMIYLPETIIKVGELAPFEGCNENLKLSNLCDIPLSSLLGKNYDLKITGLNIIGKD